MTFAASNKTRFTLVHASLESVVRLQSALQENLQANVLPFQSAVSLRVVYKSDDLSMMHGSSRQK